MVKAHQQKSPPLLLGTAHTTTYRAFWISGEMAIYQQVSSRNECPQIQRVSSYSGTMNRWAAAAWVAAKLVFALFVLVVVEVETAERLSWWQMLPVHAIVVAAFAWFMGKRARWRTRSRCQAQIRGSA